MTARGMNNEIPSPHNRRYVTSMQDSIPASSPRNVGHGSVRTSILNYANGES